MKMKKNVRYILKKINSLETKYDKLDSKLIKEKPYLFEGIKL